MLPSAGSTRAVEAPLDAERAREVLVGLDDARFDLDLRLRAIERRRSASVAVVRRSGRSRDDQRVGARIDLHRAALRQRALA